MAPRKRFITPITTAFDKRYICTRCDNDNLDRNSQVNERDWTCNTCGNPVCIELADAAGNGFTVERRHAKLLTTEDYIVFEHDPSQMAKVYASSASMGKSNLWYLALESFGSGQVDPERYYNCTP